MAGDIRISSHALDRYLQRVDKTATRAGAWHEIQRVLASGKRRPNPRRWTRIVGIHPGTTYIYSAKRPDVCLALRGGVVVTVFSKRICKKWQRNASVEHGGGRAGRGSERLRDRRRAQPTPYPYAGLG